MGSIKVVKHVFILSLFFTSLFSVELPRGWAMNCHKDVRAAIASGMNGSGTPTPLSVSANVVDALVSLGKVFVQADASEDDILNEEKKLIEGIRAPMLEFLSEMKIGEVKALDMELLLEKQRILAGGISVRLTGLLIAYQKAQLDPGSDSAKEVTVSAIAAKIIPQIQDRLKSFEKAEEKEVVVDLTKEEKTAKEMPKSKLEAIEAEIKEVKEIIPSISENTIKKEVNTALMKGMTRYFFPALIGATKVDQDIIIGIKCYHALIGIGTSLVWPGSTTEGIGAEIDALNKILEEPIVELVSRLNLADPKQIDIWQDVINRTIQKQMMILGAVMEKFEDQRKVFFKVSFALKLLDLPEDTPFDQIKILVGNKREKILTDLSLTPEEKISKIKTISIIFSSLIKPYNKTNIITMNADKALEQELPYLYQSWAKMTQALTFKIEASTLNETEKEMLTDELSQSATEATAFDENLISGRRDLDVFTSLVREYAGEMREALIEMNLPAGKPVTLADVNTMKNNMPALSGVKSSVNDDAWLHGYVQSLFNILNRSKNVSNPAATVTQADKTMIKNSSDVPVKNVDLEGAAKVLELVMFAKHT